LLSSLDFLQLGDSFPEAWSPEQILSRPAEGVTYILLASFSTAFNEKQLKRIWKKFDFFLFVLLFLFFSCQDIS